MSLWLKVRFHKLKNTSGDMFGVFDVISPTKVKCEKTSYSDEKIIDIKKLGEMSKKMDLYVGPSQDNTFMHDSLYVKEGDTKSWSNGKIGKILLREVIVGNTMTINGNAIDKQVELFAKTLGVANGDILEVNFHRIACSECGRSTEE